jgi:murein L,D-transpeptidase YcbB/YkuD
MGLGKILKSRAICLLLAIACLLACILMAYAISRDAEISFSKDKGLVICPKGNARIEELERNLAASVPVTKYTDLDARYQRLEAEYRSVSAKYAKILKVVGADVRNGDDTALETITLMAVRSKELARDVNVSLSVIRTEVSRNRSIRTQSPADDQTTIDLYMHIQKFFRSIGIYTGPINGDQAATCLAVRDFQAKYGLDVDGKIGTQTLSAMEAVFDDAESH